MIDEEKLREELKQYIVGGCHTYSRGDDQYSVNVPPLFKKGKGCYLYTVNDEKYLDYGMALRAITIGYDEPEITDSAIEQIHNGNNLTRASLTELIAAKTICNLTSHDMCKFAKNGSNVTTAAIKLSRAFTGKKHILACNQPFFSFDDWHICTKPNNKGIPEEFNSMISIFEYNDLEGLKLLFEKFKDQIACVIMEACTIEEPKIYEDGQNFLQKIKELCHENNSVFILDEMITGFRYGFPSVASRYNVIPDLSTWGKGISNGFSISCLTGKKEIMSLGSIDKIGAERVFLLSTTHGGEMSSLGAFIKTVEFYQKHNVVKHMWDYGKKLKDDIKKITNELNISDYFYLYGFDCSPYYCTKNKNKEISLEFRTLFMQEMIKNKVLMPWIAISYSHGDKELEITLNAIRDSLIVYKKALEEGIDKYLEGPCIKPVFRKYN